MILDSKVARFHSKAFSDGGGYFCKPTRNPMGGFGGGGGSTSGSSGKITRPTKREKMYMAHKVVYLRRSNLSKTDLILDVGKDRNGDTGIKELPEAIDVIAELLCEYKFQGSNQMFQTTEKLRLAEVMKNVLLGDDYIPSEKAVKEYVEGG